MRLSTKSVQSILFIRERKFDITKTSVHFIFLLQFPIPASCVVEKIMACENKILAAVSLPKVEIVVLFINFYLNLNNRVTRSPQPKV